MEFTDAYHSHAEWNVPYAPGVIEVRGSKDGKVVLMEKRETVGAPAKIALRPDRAEIDADGEDVAVITVAVQDAEGRFIPIADDAVTFTRRPAQSDGC
jgi:beta-galactosidase